MIRLAGPHVRLMSRARPYSLALGISAGLGTIFSVNAAHAELVLRTQASSRSVEVGEVFSIELVIRGDEDVEPANAKLPVPSGLQVSGPHTSTQTQVSITNGRMQRINGLTLSWSLVANQAGNFRVGPPSVDLNGKHSVGQAITVEVTPAGTARRSPPGGRRPSGFPFPLDPFDPFSAFRGQGIPGFPFDDLDAPDIPEPAAPPEYQLDHAPDQTAFLIAKATPRSVVLGEAVHLKIYSYGGAGPYEEATSNEPSHEGFLSYSVESDGRTAVPVRIGERSYIAARIRDVLLFPIQTGELRIGAMRFGFGGRGYRAPRGSGGLIRESLPIDIKVVEPPLAGRPAGYRLGDVGQYSLKASVEPRKVRQGEAVAVIAKLEGTGNIPSKLALPQQTGVDWMEPTVVEKLDTTGGKLTGSRTFTYVVRAEKAGTIDLGELTLPFYDAEQRRYEVARQPLGTIEVAADPNAPAPVAGSGKEDRLAKLVEPPRQLGLASTRGPFISDRPGFFGLLLSAPLLVLAGSGLLRVAQRARERWQARDVSPERRAQRELEAARAAAASSDLAGTAAAVERALHLALEGGTQVRSRGLLRSELAPALERRGLSRGLAEEVVELLQATENARFVQGGSGEATQQLLARGEALVGRLIKGGRT
ncbi:MAG TPA: BatD family protein [Polyangiaceae bacterium]|nr:BatD family protein [Polyangiaceae bacterium]